jgi:hypothetical protein
LEASRQTQENCHGAIEQFTDQVIAQNPDSMLLWQDLLSQRNSAVGMAQAMKWRNRD